MFEWASPHLFAILATGPLLGGMMFFSFLFAPLVFARLPADTAGAFIRAVFPVYYAVGAGLAAVGAAFAAFVSILDAALLAGIALAFVLVRQALLPAIDRYRKGRDAGDAAAAGAFGRLHGLSMVVNLVQMVALVVVLVRLVV